VTKPTVWVVGYLSLDDVVIEGRVHPDVPGGAALYAALGAAAGGAAPVLVAAAGPDFPESVLDSLRAAGIDVSVVTRREHLTRRARLAHETDGRRESGHYAEPRWHAAT
jgi:sugar/nucleoside kinase (ribokinase family)